MASTDDSTQGERRSKPHGNVCGRRWDDDQHQLEMFEWAKQDLGARLFTMRTDRHWSLERVAQGVRMKAETIADIENGRGDHKFSSITRLLAFYGYGTRVLPERTVNIASRSRGANQAAAAAS